MATERQEWSPVCSVPTLSEAELAEEIRKGTAALSVWPGVKRIWLFGSAARGEALDWRSDLDFAVEGLPREFLERAWAKLDEAVRLPVDLVRVETANTTLKEFIQRDGQVLYET